MISRSNFQKKHDQTWVDVMTADDLSITAYHWIRYCWLLKVIIICGKKIILSYYKAWNLW